MNKENTSIKNVSYSRPEILVKFKIELVQTNPETVIKHKTLTMWRNCHQIQNPIQEENFWPFMISL